MAGSLEIDVTRTRLAISELISVLPKSHNNLHWRFKGAFIPDGDYKEFY